MSRLSSQSKNYANDAALVKALDSREPPSPAKRSRRGFSRTCISPDCQQRRVLERRRLASLAAAEPAALLRSSVRRRSEFSRGV